MEVGECEERFGNYGKLKMTMYKNF